MSRDELINAVLALPRNERLKVAREVMRSLEPETSGSAWSQAWGPELNRRIAELDDDSPGTPFDEVLDALEKAGGHAS